jgi:hypothetical protein
MDMKTATIINAQVGMVPENAELIIDEENKVKRIQIGTKSVAYNRRVYYASPEERAQIQTQAQQELGLTGGESNGTS